jgi:hypothetical protein
MHLSFKEIPGSTVNYLGDLIYDPDRFCARFPKIEIIDKLYADYAITQSLDIELTIRYLRSNIAPSSPLQEKLIKSLLFMTMNSIRKKLTFIMGRIAGRLYIQHVLESTS